MVDVEIGLLVGVAIWQRSVIAPLPMWLPKVAFSRCATVLPPSVLPDCSASVPKMQVTPAPAGPAASYIDDFCPRSALGVHRGSEQLHCSRSIGCSAVLEPRTWWYRSQQPPTAPELLWRRLQSASP